MCVLGGLKTHFYSGTFVSEDKKLPIAFGSTVAGSQVSTIRAEILESLPA